jgi:hypothetical protein
MVTGTIIGGSAPGAGNVIVGYTQGAIILQDNVAGNVISGNFIGTDSTGTLALPNSFGIGVYGDPGFPSTNNTIGGTTSGSGNTIAFNTSNGVIIDGGSALTDASLNPILGNSIYDNASDGILLLNNGNDNQEVPLLVTAKLVLPSNLVTVTAMAPSTPAASNFRLEFFVNSVNNNPITEGQRFIGAIPSVSSGATITQTFSVPAPLLTADTWISATATNLNNTGNTPGDTSMFSSNIRMQTTQAHVSPINLAILAKYCNVDPGIISATHHMVPLVPL